jgi:hypothetical protein
MKIAIKIANGIAARGGANIATSTALMLRSNPVTGWFQLI